MKTIILSLTALVASIGFAQEEHQHNAWCGFDEHNQQLMEKESIGFDYIEEQLTRNRENAPNFMGGDRTNIGIVPVVVHVIHDGGVSNISYEQIESAIDQLNEDYQRLNADSSNTRNTANAPFTPVAVDMQIEFKLAKIDPQGNCTNGVQRRFSPNAAVNADDGVKSFNSGGLDGWPRDSYMNIWVVRSIGGSGQGTTLGYAQFPYFGSASTYGVVIRHDYFGTIGTGTGDRTFTHELGHCFGLFHTFQDGCSSQDCGNNGDYCCDTPPVSEAQWSCITTQNTCSNVAGNDHFGFDAFDQFENYMSYSPCQNMFSEDQRDIVHGNFSTYNWMANLISPANATATGVNQPDVLCQAEFTSTSAFICAGSTVDFTDQSYFGVTGVNWTFPGGTPSTSTSSNPVVTYNTPGVYDVTLEVTDGSNNETTTETAYVTVIADPGAPLPYQENFESITSIPDGANWFIADEDGNEPWQLNTTIGLSGTQSAWLDNFGENDQTKDDLMSGTIDLSTVDPADNIVFNFKYAYRKRSSSNDEWIRFYISKDCGETWVLRKNIHGDDLSPMTEIFPYEPLAEDWVQVDVTNINSAYYVSNFRFKFEFENDNGNNIYIDDINLYSGSMTSINEEIADNLTVFPNPVTDQMTITMDVYDSAFYTITLTNALGQQVATVYQGELMSGLGNNLTYDISALPQGVYFLNIESNGLVKSTKVLKQ